MDVKWILLKFNHLLDRNAWSWTHGLKIKVDIESEMKLKFKIFCWFSIMFDDNFMNRL